MTEGTGGIEKISNIKLSDIKTEVITNIITVSKLNALGRNLKNISGMISNECRWPQQMKDTSTKLRCFWGVNMVLMSLYSVGCT